MIDPLSPSKTSGLAWTLAGTGQCAEAIATIEQAAKLWPTFSQVWRSRLYVLGNCGREAQARAMLDAPEAAPMALEPEYRAAWRAYLGALRDRRQAPGRSPRAQCWQHG